MAYIRFSTFVTLWTQQKFQAWVADPMAQGAPASTFRTPGWARTCLIKIAKFSILYVVACTYNIDMAGIFVKLKCDGSPVFLGLPADPWKLPGGPRTTGRNPLAYTSYGLLLQPRPTASRFLSGCFSVTPTPLRMAHYVQIWRHPQTGST